MAAVLVFRHVPHEHLGTLAPVFDRQGLAYQYLDVWKKNVRFPSVEKYKALVVMGGPMGVYDAKKYPFLQKETAFIRKMVLTQRPVLGICLGAQLIAAALGAAVYPNGKKEIGWYPLRLTENGRRDPLFRRIPPQSTVFQWHGDTFDLPPGAVPLAASALCKNQAFRFGQNVYALQFHLEVDAPMIRQWLGQPGARRELAQVGPRAYADLKKSTPRHEPVLKKKADIVFSQWTQILEN